MNAFFTFNFSLLFILFRLKLYYYGFFFYNFYCYFVVSVVDIIETITNNEFQLGANWSIEGSISNVLNFDFGGGK